MASEPSATTTAVPSEVSKRDSPTQLCSEPDPEDIVLTKWSDPRADAVLVALGDAARQAQGRKRTSTVQRARLYKVLPGSAIARILLSSSASRSAPPGTCSCIKVDGRMHLGDRPGRPGCSRAHVCSPKDMDVVRHEKALCRRLGHTRKGA